MTQRILIVGYFGSGNAGDEAILASMLRGIRSSRPDVAFTVPGENPEAIAERNGVDSFPRSDLSRLLRAIEECDLVLVGGGGLLHDVWDPRDDTLLTPDHWGLTYYCGIPWLAAEMGKPVMLYAVGVGPLEFPEGRLLVRQLASAADIVTVRDESSAGILSDLAGEVMPPPECTADPVWSLEPLPEERRRAIREQAGLEGERWLGVALRNWSTGPEALRWESEASEALDRFAARHDLGIAFLPFQDAATPLQDDRAIARRMAERSSVARVRVVEGMSAAEEIEALLGGCEIVCGMRLHSLLLACVAGVPTVALEYDPKVARLAEACDPPIPSIPLPTLGRDGLLAALEEVWSSREPRAASARRLAETMRPRAAENVRLALSLLAAGSPRVPAPRGRRIFDAVAEIERARERGGTAPRIGERPASASRTGFVRIVAHTFFDSEGREIFYGGGERYLIEIARLLKSRGYRVEVVQTAARPWVRYYRDLRVVGIVPTGGPFSLNGAIRARGTGNPELTLYLAFYQAGPDPPPHAIGISHGIYWDSAAYQGDPAEVRRRTSRVFDSLSRLDAVVSVDTNTINWVRTERAALAEKLIYLPNFVDRDEFRPRERPPGPLVVLYPRRLSRERGFWLMEEIVPALLRAHDDLEFHFVGKADEMEEKAIRALVDRFDGRVRWYFLSPDEMSSAYRGADVVVIPTLSSEGTSLSCLEGQASGKPVVATRVGGLPDLVLDGVNGLLIEPDAGALRVAIERLIDDPGLRRRLGESARETSAPFSIERWRSRWSGVLDRYLPPRSAGAVRRARRAPLTAVFSPPREASRAAREELAGVAISVAAAGIDTFWVEEPGKAPAKHPRLHGVRPSETLWLEAPLVFLRGDSPPSVPWPATRFVKVGEASGDAGPEEDSLPLPSDPGFSRALREVIRRALRRRLEEVPMTTETSGGAGRIPPAGEGDLARYRSRLVEHEMSIVDMRRRAIAERVEARAIIAEMDARDRAHEAEHARARRHQEEVAREGQRAVESWQRAVQELRSELDQWKQSRIWRLGQSYWTFLARLRWIARGGALRGQPMPSTPKEPAPAGSAEGRSPAAASRPVAALPEGFLPRPEGRYDVLVLSIIDWDFRFQRPQQLAAQFGRAGHRVFYLSTSAFLPPGGAAFSLSNKAPNVAELRLRSPRSLDIYAGELTEKDLDALEDSLGELFADAASGDLLVKVDIPFWAPLAFRLRERFGAMVVYDCMDEWTNFPGFGKRVLDREEELVRKADATVVSADRLVDKHEAAAARLVLARNAVDVEHYASLFAPNDILGSVSRPVIGYYGALASWVDVPLLEKIALRFPDATIVLAGGHFDVDLSGLAALPNVRLLGQRPYDEMPKLLWNFDVCIIPFIVNEITEATNPVKFYEYLVGEKPVVAPELTELKPFAELCYLSRGHEEFLRHIDEALAESADDPRRPARRAVAEANDWSARYRAIDDAVAASCPNVSVVVVTFGGFEFTRDCLDTLRRETWPRLEIVVVDNASSDATVPYLQRIASEDSRVRLIRNPENRGFAAANNAGIAVAGGDIVVLLNNDTVVPPGLMGRLVSHLRRDPTIGLVCPTTNFAGNEAKIDPGYTDLADLPAWSNRRAREHAGKVFPLEVAAMYCVAARREVLEEVGPLDENFRIGMFEDDDFSLRIRQAGFTVVCAEDAYVHHVGQGSFRKLSPEAYQELWNRNKSYFETKWGVAWKPHQARRGTTPASSKIGS